MCNKLFESDEGHPKVRGMSYRIPGERYVCCGQGQVEEVVVVVPYFGSKLSLWWFHGCSSGPG